jgi:cytoskeletal protein CcmA (bactofilin family)
MSTTDRPRHTLVEEGTELKGTMSSKVPIVVMGKVEGDLSGPSIEIARSGVVAGTVKVGELRSEGELAGDVVADTVFLSGRVRDNTVIKAATLEVKLATSSDGMEVTFGICELAVGDEPSKEAAIAAATSKPVAAAAPVMVAASPPAEPAPAEPASAEPAKAAEAVRSADSADAKDGDWEMPRKDEAEAAPEGDRRGKNGRRNRGTQPPPPA